MLQRDTAGKKERAAVDMKFLRFARYLPPSPLLSLLRSFYMYLPPPPSHLFPSLLPPPSPLSGPPIQKRRNTNHHKCIKGPQLVQSAATRRTGWNDTLQLCPGEEAGRGDTTTTTPPSFCQGSCLVPVDHGRLPEDGCEAAENAVSTCS